jgi:hypothetical protein
MLSRGKVSIVLTEMIFDSMYEGITRFDKWLTYLADRNYKIVGVYDQYRRNGALAWADVLFVEGSLSCATEPTCLST